MCQLTVFKEIAERAGALLVPVAGLEGHCLYVKGKGAGFFPNADIEKMDGDRIQSIVTERTRPIQARPAAPTHYATPRRRHSLATGRFKRMEKVQ